MKRRDRVLSVALVVAVIAGIKVAQQLYRFYLFEDERMEIVRLERDVEAEGLGVIGTQLRADTLRRQIDEADDRLRAARDRLSRFDGGNRSGTIAEGPARTYGEDLAAYNQLVLVRQELFREWRRTVDNNHAHVDRYNLFVDSIRRLADRMGEPYYPILTPAEIMVRSEGSAQAP